MTKEISDNYSIEEVPTQVSRLAVNLKDKTVLTDEAFKVEVLNKLDKILKSVG